VTHCGVPRTCWKFCHMTSSGEVLDKLLKKIIGRLVFGSLVSSSLHDLFGPDDRHGGTVNYQSPTIFRVILLTVFSCSNTTDKGHFYLTNQQEISLLLLGYVQN
jgi:hypothetical protein